MVKQILARLEESGLQVDIDEDDLDDKSVKHLGSFVEAGKGMSRGSRRDQAVKQRQ